MSTERKKWRAKQKAKRREELLDIRNAYGVNDPTPYFAHKDMVAKERRGELRA